MADPEIQFIEEPPTLTMRNDIGFLHVNDHEFAMRPNMAIRFVEAAFRNIADWLASKTTD
ncbi:MAG: hypothetical protein JWL86_42 [Rhizobium sp.]|nr:hypothetical protein [Rhizobium sp.]